MIPSPTETTAPARTGLVPTLAHQFRKAGRICNNRLLVTGSVLFLAMVLLALVAGVVTTAHPEDLDVMNRFHPPSAQFLFGTDNFGRSVFSRVAYGARISLGIGFAVVVLTAVLGIAVGAIAGYFRRFDNIIMRVMDGLMAFPSIMLALAIAAILGPSALNAVIALAIVYTPNTARIVRSSVLVLRESEYVDAARVIGASDWRILRRHIIPNSLAPLIVQLTFVFAYSVLAESILSFLGAGPPPPTPSWGNVISDGRSYMREAPWIVVFPGLAILATALGLNLMGDGLRDQLDPRLSTARD